MPNEQFAEKFTTETVRKLTERGCGVKAVVAAARSRK